MGATWGHYEIPVWMNVIMSGRKLFNRNREHEDVAIK